jgi:hypothetical protein
MMAERQSPTPGQQSQQQGKRGGREADKAAEARRGKAADDEGAQEFGELKEQVQAAKAKMDTVRQGVVVCVCGGGRVKGVSWTK